MVLIIAAGVFLTLATPINLGVKHKELMTLLLDST